VQISICSAEVMAANGTVIAMNCASSGQPKVRVASIFFCA